MPTREEILKWSGLIAALTDVGLAFWEGFGYDLERLRAMTPEERKAFVDAKLDEWGAKAREAAQGTRDRLEE